MSVELEAEGKMADFTPVMAALREYAARTGAPPVMLGGWEADDPAIAPPVALMRRLAAIKAQPRHYTYSKDFQSARELAANLWRGAVRYPGGELAPQQIAVLPNSSQGLFLALTALRAQGVRRAVIAAPCYYAVVAVCRHLGLDMTIIPAADYRTGALDIPRLARALGRDAVLILTNPAYSVGVEYTPEQLSCLFAALPEDAYILLDETRIGLSWRYAAPWYAGDFPRNALILRSPSKIFLLNGSKASFLIGPVAVIHAIEQLSEALLGSVAGNLEAVALAYLRAWEQWQRESMAYSQPVGAQWQQESVAHPHPVGAQYIAPLPTEMNTPSSKPDGILAWKHDLIAELAQNHDLARALLEPHGFTLAPVDSGPYALAAIPRHALPDLDSLRLAREHGVLLMTSEYFYHTQTEWVGFRVNLCGCPGQMREGVRRVLSEKSSFKRCI